MRMCPLDYAMYAHMLDMCTWMYVCAYVYVYALGEGQRVAAAFNITFLGALVSGLTPVTVG